MDIQLLLTWALFVLVCTRVIESQVDFVVKCDQGYKVSGIRRINSFYQRNVSGSLIVECEKLVDKVADVTCTTQTMTPMCNGSPEGCGADQWLAGFQVFLVENTTNTQLLDPICCSSPGIKIEAITCAAEKLNNPKEAFEHIILAEDLVYRGMQCWHQYNSNNTLIDLVWKLEICQSQSQGEPFVPIKQQLNCPPCDCHCGIDLCADGKEPIRLIHKNVSREKCACDCLCHYQCIGSSEVGDK